MFNDARKALIVERRKYYKKTRSRYYSGWDVGICEPYEVEHNGVTYHCDQEYYYIVDDYDDAIASVELSHHESTGYSIVDRYEGETTELDFRFMRAQDVTNITCGDEIESITINSVNLRYSLIRCSHPLNITIVVNTGLIDTLNSLKIFIRRNASIIGSINFVGATPFIINATNSMVKKGKRKKFERKNS